jgi:hypothetical protein
LIADHWQLATGNRQPVTILPGHYFQNSKPLAWGKKNGKNKLYFC